MLSVKCSKVLFWTFREVESIQIVSSLIFSPLFSLWISGLLVCSLLSNNTETKSCAVATAAASAKRDKDGGAETVLEDWRVSMMEAPCKKKKDFPMMLTDQLDEQKSAHRHKKRRFKWVAKVVRWTALFDLVCTHRAAHTSAGVNL